MSHVMVIAIIMTHDEIQNSHAWGLVLRPERGTWKGMVLGKVTVYLGGVGMITNTLIVI